MRGCKRSMAAKVHLNMRRKPAYVKSISLWNNESGFGEVVLKRNGLHQVIGQPAVHDTYRSRVAGKEFVGECVYYVLFHC